MYVVLYRCPSVQSSIKGMKKTKWYISLKFYKNRLLTRAHVLPAISLSDKKNELKKEAITLNK